MNITAFFIKRPVATTLMAVAILIAGGMAFSALPVASLPQFDLATITVASQLPGASPEVMASSVATPLERQFGRIAGITQMTSSSTLGTTSITLQFDYSRDVDGAARDVQAAINAARTYLPANLPSNPKVTFDGRAATILFANATQINAVIPFEVSAPSTVVSVESVGGFSPCGRRSLGCSLPMPVGQGS